MSVDILIINNRIKNSVLDLVNDVLREARIDDERIALTLAFRLARMHYYNEAKKVLREKFERAREELLVLIVPISGRLSEETRRKIEEMMRW